MKKMTKEEAEHLSEYLKGYSDGVRNEKIYRASEYLDRFAYHICGEGFICNGGKNCTSDHK